MNPLEELIFQAEDKERINDLLEEIGDVIARNNTQGLELYWVLWAEKFFGSDFSDDMGENEIIVPEAFYDIDIIV